MTPRERANLSRAAEFLETLQLPPKSSWDVQDFGSQRDCGTSACALGWIALQNVFPTLSCKFVAKYNRECKYLDFFIDGKPFDSDEAARAIFGDEVAFWWPSWVSRQLDEEDLDEMTLTASDVARAIRSALAD